MGALQRKSKSIASAGAVAGPFPRVDQDNVSSKDPIPMCRERDRVIWTGLGKLEDAEGKGAAHKRIAYAFRSIAEHQVAARVNRFGPGACV